MTAGIKWLASYPKSGNTWARLFLLNWHLDQNEPVHPNKLDETVFAPADDAQWLIQCATGMQPQELKPEAFYFLRTALQRHFVIRSTAYNRPTYMKTHSPNRTMMGFYPMIDWDVTASAVYFVRDPRDVLPSFAAHTNNGLDKMLGYMMDDSYAVQRPIGTVSPIGNWIEHVKSWEAKATVIRYEDLPGGFEALLEAFGLPRDERFDKAVEFTRLELLSGLEDKDSFVEASDHTKFFGGKRRPINKTQRERLEEAFGEVMERYGYPVTAKREAA